MDDDTTPQQDQAPSTPSQHSNSAASQAEGLPGSLTLSTPRPTSDALGDTPSSNSTSQFGPVGPMSSWSTGSEMQLGHNSAASDMSGDRVFPIRSVVSVDPATRRISGDEYFPGIDGDGRGIPVHRPANPRTDTSLPRRDTGPLSPTYPSASERAQVRRKSTLAGPFSSIQADAVRHSTPLHLDIADSDKDTEESNHQTDEALPAGLHPESVSGASESQSANDLPHLTTRFTHAVTEEGHAVITGRDGVLQRCEDEPIHTPGAVQSFGVLLALREEQDGRFLVRYVSENSERMLGYTPNQLFRLKNFLDILSEEQQDNLLDHIDFIRDEDADPAINGPEVFSLSARLPKRKSTKLWCAIHINPAHPDLVICEFESDDDVDHPLRPSEELMPDAPHDTLQANPTLEDIEASTEILSKPLRILRSARKRRGEQGAMQVFDIMSQVQEQLSSAANLETFLKILVGIVKELTGFHRVMIYQFDSSYNGKVVTELVDTAQTRDLFMGLNFPASDIPRQARDLYKLNKVRLLYDRDLETARIVCRSKEDLDIPLDMSHAYLRAMSPIHLKYLANMAVRSSMSISINAFNELWGLIACHSYGNQGMRVSFPIRKMCRLVGDTASRNIERLSYASRLQARKLINTAPTDKNPSGYIIASSDDLLRLFDADFGLLSIKGETKILGVMEQSQEALVMLEYLRMRSLTSVVASQDVGQDFPDLRYQPGFQVIAGLLYVPLSVGGHDFIVFFRKGKFIEVWRQKEAAIQSSKLTRLLLANSAHEVRTPLNAIINYLEIALEGSLDQETRENLARSHSASKSLIYVINDLLDLTKTEQGQNLIKDEIFDLPACIQEATEPFQVDAKRKSIDYEVTQHPGLPRLVHGDGRRLRQALSNVTANAVAHTNTGGRVKVDVFVSAVKDRQATVEFVVSDTGVGMSTQQLDALFRDLEQVSDEIDSISSADRGDSADARALGLGLAVVARIVRNMDGQLRLKSEEGQGSRFVIQLPFQLQKDSPDVSMADDDNAGPEPHRPEPIAQAPASLTAAPEGEILLVDRASGINVNLEDNAGSERGSASSFVSQTSQKSGAERLIDAIQTPLSLNDRDPFLSRKDSRGSRESFAEHKSPVRSSKPTSPVSQKAKALPLTHTREEPGSAEVRDSKTPIRAVRIPDDFTDMPSRPQQGEQSGVLFEIPSSEISKRSGTESVTSAGTGDGLRLQILIAEDDPINMKIMRKRLEKSGHQVHQTVNGEDCATVYTETPSTFDAVLMDMQMPIVDGLTSTKMIRKLERSSEHRGHSSLAHSNGRIPIFAVSASLLEKDKDMYVDAGFDGWILKPIDFKRLSVLLSGIHDEEARNSCLYVAGEWERGGWFSRRKQNSQSGDDATPKADDVHKEMGAPPEAATTEVKDFAEADGQAAT
ncbi:hypothetical protein S40293_00723 [Stachybotrys chartarum IBT 40293]|nr:hypothetical protein S40293_00723 [Stachybotrys chartarum IBT 40293]